jgi:hypothetical protein
MEIIKMGLFDGMDLGGGTAVATEERVAGSSNYINKTGAYDVIVKKAYMDTSSGGAICFNLVLETEDSKQINITEYISNTKKEVYYTDKKDGTKKFMPSYTRMKNIDFLLTGKPQQNPKTELKKVKIYDYDAKAELIKDKEVLVEWVGKPLTILCMKKKYWKQVKDSSGAYVNTSETQLKTEVDFFLDAVSRKTHNEISGNKEADIYKIWIEKYGSDDTFVYDKTGATTKTSSEQSKPITPDDIFN